MNKSKNKKGYIPKDQWDKMTPEEKELAKRGRQERGKPDHNDWEFYALDEQIARDVGSFPYNVLAGTSVRLSFERNSSGEAVTGYCAAVPQGVMALSYDCVPGRAEVNTDAINMAATQLYTFVRHANSGARIYEAADIMMYILAMSDIYANFFEAKRALGLVQYFPMENRSLPDLLLTAVGIDPTDLRGSIAQYRGRLNVLAEKLNAWAVPKYFKAFMRRAYIAGNTFADSTSVRGQFYVFVKRGSYFFDTTTEETGTSLQYKQAVLVNRTMGDLLDTIDAQLDALLLDEDAQTMSGDILKAFTTDNLYQVEGCNETYMVPPVMDEDILAQIENSFGYYSFAQNGGSITAESINIKQLGQLIVFQPEIIVGGASAAAFAVQDAYVFNSHKDNPEFKDNLEWSRLITTARSKINTDGTVTITLVGFGLELLAGYSLYFKSPASSTVMQQSFSNLIIGTTVSRALGKVMQYDWHPILYWAAIPTVGTTAAAADVSFVADLKKWTVLSKQAVENVHNAANQASYYAKDVYKFMQRDYTK